MVTDATGLEGCRLEIEQIPATVSCQDCDAVTTLDAPDHGVRAVRWHQRDASHRPGVHGRLA